MTLWHLPHDNRVAIFSAHQRDDARACACLVARTLKMRSMMRDDVARILRNA
jgi:hypothetical protein